MNIDKFKTKSDLIEIRLDTDEIKEKYGDEIIFYTQSHPKLTTYFNFFESRVNGDYDKLEGIVRSLILNKDGKPALKDDETLPPDIFTQVILSLGEQLGKSTSRASTSKVGELQK